MTNPITAATPGRLQFDAGALYFGPYPPGTLMGATRGGSVFTWDEELRDIEIDGSRGPVDELVRPIAGEARLETTIIEINENLLNKILRTIGVSDGTDISFRPTSTVVAGDFVSKVVLVADVAGSSNPAILTLENVLRRGPFTLTVRDKDEGTIGVQWVAHYDLSNPTQVPWTLEWPVEAS